MNSRYRLIHFVPDHFSGGRIPIGASETLPTISQGVRGATDLLLMEPVVPTRHQLDEDLKNIGTRFFAYRGALQKHSVDAAVKFIAYMIPGGDSRRRAEIVGRLGDSADRIFDAGSMSDRRELVSTVSAVGESGREEELI